MDETIVVKQGNDPLLTFHLQRVDKDGNNTPYIITGATIELIVKDDLAKTDVVNASNAMFNQSGSIVADGTAVGAEYSVCSVQLTAAQLATAGIFYYHLDAIISGRRDTVMRGYIEIVNI